MRIKKHQSSASGTGGGEADFKQRFLPHAQAMYRTAWRLTGNAQEAEDLVQEAFLTLWTKRGKLNVSTDAEAYCRATVRNLYLNSLRRPSMDGTEDLSLAANKPAGANGGDLQEALEQRDAAQLMLALIRRLPEAWRIVVTLRDVEGLSYDEIATSLQTTEGNVRVLLSRARKQLREQFKLLDRYGRNSK